MFENLSTDAIISGATKAIETSATNITLFLPNLIVAILVLIFGWVIATLISRVFAALLKSVKLEDYLKQHKVGDALGTVKVSSVLTKVVKYYVILLFFEQAASFVALGDVSDFLRVVLFYAPLLIAGVLVALVAFLLGEYIKESLEELDPKSALVKFVARASKWVIVYVGVTMALATAHFDTVLLNGIFLTILQALVYGLALAFGIAFGFGGQKDAQDMLGDWRKHLKV